MDNRKCYVVIPEGVMCRSVGMLGRYLGLSMRGIGVIMNELRSFRVGDVEVLVVDVYEDVKSGKSVSKEAKSCSKRAKTRTKRNIVIRNDSSVVSDGEKVGFEQEKAVFGQESGIFDTVFDNLQQSEGKGVEYVGEFMGDGLPLELRKCYTDHVARGKAKVFEEDFGVRVECIICNKSYRVTT